MKQQPITNEELKLLVACRIQRARETLSEVDFLMKDGFLNAVVNRLYYATGRIKLNALALGMFQHFCINVKNDFFHDIAAMVTDAFQLSNQ